MPEHDILLYAADTPNTWKPASLLEELGVEYDVRIIDIMANEQKQPEFLALNPNGRTPALVDRSISPPFAVFERSRTMGAAPPPALGNATSACDAASVC